jgi:hypothetical protein
MAFSFMNLFAVLVLAASSCVALAPGAALPSGRAMAVQSRSMSMAYVPDGLTPEQWKAIKVTITFICLVLYNACTLYAQQAHIARAYIDGIVLLLLWL